MTLRPLPQHKHRLPTVHIPHKSGTFVTIDEPTPTHLYHLQFAVCTRVQSWCLRYRFGYMYQRLRSIVEFTSQFHCSKTLCAPPTVSSLSSVDNHQSFFLGGTDSIFLLLYIQKWNHRNKQGKESLFHYPESVLVNIVLMFLLTFPLQMLLPR